MSKHTFYQCDICSARLDEDKVIGLVSRNQNVDRGGRARMRPMEGTLIKTNESRSAEKHICEDCLTGISKIQKELKATPIAVASS